MQQRRAHRILGMVGADRMAALAIFMIIDRAAGRLQLRRHLARMARMHPVILGRQVEEGGRILHPGLHILIGRPFGHERPVRRHIGIAIFRHPGRAGRQMRIALHILQRRPRDHRAIEVGPLGHRRAHQHAAIGAAGNADIALGRHAGLDQILGHRSQIVERILALLAQRILMPGRAIFAAAPDIGEDIGIAIPDPEQAQRPGAIGFGGEVGRRLCRAEPAIGMDERRHRSLDALLARQEIGHLRPVLRRRKALLHHELAGVEARGQLLDRARRPLRSCHHQARRGQHPLDRGEDPVALVVGADQMDRRLVGQRHRTAGPATGGGIAGHRQQRARHIVELLHPQDIVGGAHFLDHGGRGRLQHDLRRPRLARRHIGDRPGHQRSGRNVAQRLVQQHDHLAADQATEIGRIGHRCADQLAVRALDIEVVGVEGQRPVDEDPAFVAILLDARPHRNVAVDAFLDQRCGR